MAKKAQKTATVRARIEPSIKKKAERRLKEMGMSQSQAINLFYHNMAVGCAFPFSPHIPNAETRKAIHDLEAGKGEVFTGSTEEFFEELERDE